MCRFPRTRRFGFGAGYGIRIYMRFCSVQSLWIWIFSRASWGVPRLYDRRMIILRSMCGLCDFRYHWKNTWHVRLHDLAFVYAWGRAQQPSFEVLCSKYQKVWKIYSISRALLCLLYLVPYSTALLTVPQNTTQVAWRLARTQLNYIMIINGCGHAPFWRAICF